MLTDAAAVAIRETVYDAAVVGAGIVGLATAVALAGAGHRVALVERRPPERLRGALGFEQRTVALTPGSLNFLRAQGGVDDADLTPVKAMQVWEHDGSGSLQFACDRPLAYVAENSALTTRLWRSAEASVDIFAGSSVTGLARTSRSVELAGPGLAARLVVAADGAASVVRRLTGTSVRCEPPYRRGTQCAIATVARATRPHGNVAYQRFGRHGPVALLPLVDASGADAGATSSAVVAVIWSTWEFLGHRLQSLNDADFRAALDRETEGVLGDFVDIDRRLSFPIRQALTADFNPWPRVLIVGDAARTLHPLAGQGVNVGLEDARSLAVAASGPDLGASGRWRGFARERRMRSKLMMVSMRALFAAYCGSHAADPWLRWARNASVRRIDSSPGVKAQLVREAMGLGPLAVPPGTPAAGAGNPNRPDGRGTASQTQATRPGGGRSHAKPGPSGGKGRG